MKNIKHTTFICAGALTVAALLSGCTCPSPVHHKKPKTEPVVFYQTYEDADVNKVVAKMYTNNSNGGTSKMGHIKFYETDSGLKMSVNLQDLRPNKTYHVKVHHCGPCNGANTCCDKNSMNIDLPNLTNDSDTRLEKSYIIRGLTATQLKNAKIYLERDGGYKAAWGVLK